MNEIKPTYVTFEQAKWLKEKNFHSVKCLSYNLEGYELPNYCYNLEGDKQWIARPEQWQVVEWLRINHGIWIAVVWYHEDNLVKWNCFVDKIGDFNMLFFLDEFNSPQEAYSAAFDYIKDNNLI